jgi:hypothetical protein
MAGWVREHRSLNVWRSLCALMVLACLGDIAAAQVPCRYEYVQWPNMDCGFGPYPGGPVAINVHGHVCIGWGTCGSPAADVTAIWYGSGNPVILPIPQGYRSMKPADMNDFNEIVGTLELPMGTPNPIRAFIRLPNRPTLSRLPLEGRRFYNSESADGTTESGVINQRFIANNGDDG